MANTYVAPNFNCDTSANVAGLTTLKGSAIDGADYIYAYGVGGVFPTITVEQSLAIMLISLGETSSGAAASGQKRAQLKVNAGVTITFTGAAANTGSGIKMNPASGATESKGISCTVSGTISSIVTFTNSTGAMDTAKRWSLYNTYGALDITYCDFNFNYTQAIYVSASSSKTTAPSQKVNYCRFKGMSSSTQQPSIYAISNIDIALDLRNNTTLFDTGITTGSLFYFGGYWLTAGGSVDCSQSVIGPVTGSGYGGSPMNAAAVSGRSVYFAGCKVAYSDIRATAQDDGTTVIRRLA